MGKNFSTIEVGKTMIYDFIKERCDLKLFEGFETKELREELKLKKGLNKSARHFNSHCVDSFTIAHQFSKSEPNFDILVVDDTYKPKRRRLHDTQFSKGGVRDKYSSGNFKGIRKGSICNFGQMAGGTKNYAYLYNLDGERIGKVLSKINWLSHQFKTMEGISPPLNKMGGLRNAIRL